MGRRNFQLKENIYSLNLGKVADAASYEGMEIFRKKLRNFRDLRRICMASDLQ